MARPSFRATGSGESGQASMHTSELPKQRPAKAEAARMTSASGLGSESALEVPFCGRPLRAAQGRAAGSWVASGGFPGGFSQPRLLFPLLCSVDGSLSPRLPGHKTLPSEGVTEA